MNRDQVWSLKRDIERHLQRGGEDQRAMDVADHRQFGASTPEEITSTRLLRRTLAVLEEL